MNVTVRGGAPYVGVAVNPARFPDPATTRKACSLLYVNVPLGNGRDTATSFTPTVSDIGIPNCAVMTYWLVCVSILPEFVPMVTVLGAIPAGGTGGVLVELRMNVTVNPLTPCVATAGDTLRMPLVTVASARAGEPSASRSNTSAAIRGPRFIEISLSFGVPDSRCPPLHGSTAGCCRGTRRSSVTAWNYSPAGR